MKNFDKQSPKIYQILKSWKIVFLCSCLQQCLFGSLGAKSLFSADLEMLTSAALN